MRDGQMQDINIGTENFGAEDTMQIRQEKNTKKIKEYIANQLKEDQEVEQLVVNVEDPFKGSK